MAGEDTVIRLDIDSEPAVRGLQSVERSMSAAASRSAAASATFQDGARKLAQSIVASQQLSASYEKLGKRLTGLSDTARRVMSANVSAVREAARAAEEEQQRTEAARVKAAAESAKQMERIARERAESERRSAAEAARAVAAEQQKAEAERARAAVEAARKAEQVARERAEAEKRAASEQRATQQQLAASLRAASQERAREVASAREAATIQREAAGRAVGDIRARVAQSGALRVQVERLNLSEREQITILGQLESQARQSEAALREMFMEGRIGAERFQAELDRVQAEMRQVQSRRNALAPPAGPSFGGEVASGLGISGPGGLGGAATVAAAGAVVAGVMAVKVAFEAAARAAVRFGVDSVKAAMEAERAQLRLQRALEIAGEPQMVEGLERFNRALELTTGRSGEALAGIQSLALSMGVGARDLPVFTEAAVALSAALGTDLESAAQQLAQTLDGTAGKLGTHMPQVFDELTEAQLKAGVQIDIIRDKFGGMARTDLETFSGAINRVKTEFGEIQKEFGNGIIRSAAFRDALRDLADMFTGISLLVAPAVAGLASFKDEVVKFGPIVVGVLNPLAGALVWLGADGAENMRALGAAAREAAGDVAGLGKGLTEEQRDMQARIEADSAKLKARKVQETKDAEAARQRAAEEAARAAEALREQIAAISGLTAKTAEQRAEIAGMNLTLEREVELYGILKGSVEAGAAALFKLYQDGKIQASEYLRILENVIGAKDQLASETLVARAQQRIAGQGSEFFEPISTFAPEGEASLTGTDGLGFTDPDGESAMARVAREEAEAKERLKVIDEELFQLRLTIAEQGGPRLEQEQMLNDLLWEQQAIMAGLSEEEMRLERQRRDAMAVATEKGQKDVARMDSARQGMSMMTQAAGQLGAGLMKMALTGEGSFKQMAQAMLQGLAIQSAGKAVFELAEGLAALALAAMGHPTAGASAGLHFKSAAMFGVMAGAFGAMSAAAGQPSEGGGGDAGGGGTSESLTDQGSARRAATEEPQAGPRVQVNISGAGFIGAPDELARHLEGYLSDTIRDSGGRSGSYRG